MVFYTVIGFNLRPNNYRLLPCHFRLIRLLLVVWLYYTGYNRIKSVIPVSDVKMLIPLDRQSEQPLYQQIEAYFRECILSGSLGAETRLPSTRQLASDLGVNRITIETAYRALEADGLIYSRVGSGTYVLAPQPEQQRPRQAPGEPWPLWQAELLTQPGTEEISPVEELPAVASHPAPISFASGSSDTRLFPSEDFRKVIQAVMRRDGAEALDYGDAKGYSPLRATIAGVLTSQGLMAHAENILITGGSQQGLSLVVQLLLKAGDTILVENPTYSGALSLFRALGLRIIGVAADQHGMRVEELESLLQVHHPRLIYTMPTFQNPTGSCLSLPRRHQLLALAERYNLPVLEDDYVGDLRYEGRSLPALKALDNRGLVIYISTYSKMFMPGLRVGFVAAEGPVYERLVDFKRLSDLATSNLLQRAVEAYVSVGRYQNHLRRCVHIYRKRRDAMLQALNRCMPAGVKVNPPLGGLFIWLRLPQGLSARELLPLACKEGVAFAPGDDFFVEGSTAGYLRLNFTAHPPEVIGEGVERLGRVVKQAL